MDRCEARVYERKEPVNWHRCERRAVGERQGRGACKRHLATTLAPYWVRPGEGDRGSG